LSVSILAGPSVPALLQQITATKTKVRLGLLTSAGSRAKQPGESETTQLIVEELWPSSAEHGYDPARIAEQIRAIADKGLIDHLMIECGVETPAMAFASLFVPGGETGHALAGVAALTNSVLAIAPSTLLNELIHRRGAAENVSLGFITEQLEFVDVIVLESTQNHSDSGLARAVATTLNPRALVLDLSESTLKELLANTASFDFAAALDSAGWRRLIDESLTEPMTRLEKVSAFAYRARTPFHPERFWNLLRDGLSGVFRAKGFFWLATRMDLVGGLNLAGAESHCAAAGQWWAARDEYTRQHEMPERTQKEWKEPFGDRRQAIAFMTLDLDPDILKAKLDACLLTDAEVTAGADSWQALTDPFPSWSHHSHDHECDHDHESDEHDCCHH